jgi:hypothetical protein
MRRSSDFIRLSDSVSLAETSLTHVGSIQNWQFSCITESQVFYVICILQCLKETLSKPQENRYIPVPSSVTNLITLNKFVSVNNVVYRNAGWHH